MCQICRSWFHFAAAIVVHINCAFEFSIFYLPVHELHILRLFQLFFFSSFERVFLSIFISSLSFTYSSLSSYFFLSVLTSFFFFPFFCLSFQNLSFKFWIHPFFTYESNSCKPSFLRELFEWFLIFAENQKLTKQNFSNAFWFLLKIFRLRNELYSGLAIVFVQRQL